MSRQGDNWEKVLDKAVATATDVLRSQKELLKQRFEELKKKEAAFEKNIAERRAQLLLQGQQQQQAIKAEYQKLEDERKAMEGVYNFQSSRVKLDVGGQRFTTSHSTLTKHPGSMLAAMFSGRHKLIQDEESAYFIDRDGTHFRHVLNFLRDEDSSTLPDDQYTLKELVKEAKFYQIGSLSEAIRSILVPPKPKMSQQEMNSRLMLSPYLPPHQFSRRGRGGRGGGGRGGGGLGRGGHGRMATVSTRPQTQTGANAVISDLDLSSLSFTGVYFSHPCSFKGCIMKNVTFSDCYFNAQVDLSNTDLTNASFTECSGLTEGYVIFSGAVLDGVKFDGEAPVIPEVDF